MNKLQTIIAACRSVVDRLRGESGIAPQNRGADADKCEQETAALQRIVDEGPCHSMADNATRLSECLYVQQPDVVAALVSPPFGEAFAAAQPHDVIGVPVEKIRLANAYHHYLREHDDASLHTLQTAAQGHRPDKATTAALFYIVKAARNHALPVDRAMDILRGAPFMQQNAPHEQSYQQFLFKELFRRPESGVVVKAALAQDPAGSRSLRAAIQAVATDSNNPPDTRKEAQISLGISTAP